jgi:hypothetical protein
VLLGRVEPPRGFGQLTLMEYADAFYASGSELTYLILKAERDGTIKRNSDFNKFRTGQLRTFSTCPNVLQILVRAGVLTHRTLRGLRDGGHELEAGDEVAAEEPRMDGLGELPPIVEAGVDDLLAGEFLHGLSM